VGAGTGRDAGVGGVGGIGRAVFDGLDEGLIALFNGDDEVGVEVVLFIDTPFSFVRFELSFLAPAWASTSALRLIPLTPQA
jgi:hypothetical protein